MRKSWLKIAAISLLILFPVLAHWAYRRLTALPEQIVIATGPPAGRYRDVAESLAAAIEAELPVQVKTMATEGSLENLRLLRAGRVHLALHQRGRGKGSRAASSTEMHNPAFIANLYSEVTQFVVRRGADIQSPADLPGKRVAVGRQEWGEYQMSLILLDHFGLDEQAIEVRHLGYREIERAFRAGRLDAAFMTAGLQAPAFSRLYRTGQCRLLSIPYAEALTNNHPAISRCHIPAGMYQTLPQAIPEENVQTVAVRAQLLSRLDVHTGLIEEVTRVLFSDEFLETNRLAELARHGDAFARQNPEFSLHPGARNVYEPELKPLLNPKFVDATENLRSFVVSVLIAGFLGFRWLQERAAKKKEHRLDRYMRALLEIEQRQVALDAKPNAEDAERLQELLDEVVALRQEALRELDARALSRDRAADCFLEMCHALSDKINAKLSRQRLDQRFNDLLEALHRREGST